MQADGHCLYRAVGDQLGSPISGAAGADDLWAIRAKAAAYMREHPDQFVPFMPEACSSAAFLFGTRNALYVKGFRSFACWPAVCVDLCRDSVCPVGLLS